MEERGAADDVEEEEEPRTGATLQRNQDLVYTLRIWFRLGQSAMSRSGGVRSCLTWRGLD